MGGHAVAGLEFTPAQAVNKLAASTGSIQRGTKLGIFYLQYVFELINALCVTSGLTGTKQDGQNRKSCHAPADEAQQIAG